MKQQKWTRLAAVTGIVVMLATGCSVLDKKEQSQPIDPPQAGAADAGQAKAVSAPIANPMQITVFAKDERGLLAPIALQTEKSESVAKKALEYLVEGGPAQGHMPAGFTSVLPKGTKVKDMNIKDKLAVVDFSKEFNEYNLQDERKMLEAVTWTLTSFPTVEKVQIRVEGKALKEMPVGGTPMDEPFTRAMGINLEKPEGVEYGQASAVTLYFLSQNQEEFKYYVPVTRMVKRTDNIAQAVIEQLIQGPDEKKGLAAVMTPGAELIKVGKENDLITVNFSDKMLGPDKKVPGEAMKSLVLSLTENAGAAAKVQILVNGEAKLTTTDNQSLAKPVVRPSTVNQIKL